MAEPLRAIQLLALANVLLDDKDPVEARAYFMRRVCRWYSKTFSTPLHEVEALPVNETLRAFFEVRYEDMDEAQLEEERKHLTETAVERRAREAEEAEFEIEEIARVKEIEAEEQQRLARIAKKRGRIIDKEDETLEAGQFIIETIGGKAVAEVSTKTSRAIVDEPEVKMSWVDADFFESEISGGALGNEPKKS